MDHEFSLRAVPQSHRVGFMKMFAVMMGLTFFSASMLSGGELGLGLTFQEFIWMVLLGNLILGLYTSGLAYMAAKTGLSTHLLARYAFGEKGSYLASFLLGATQVGWFGVGLAMFAVPVHKVTGIDMWLLVILSGIVMTASAFYGMKALAILSFIAVPAIAIIGSVSIGIAVDDLGGIAQLANYQPETSLGLAAALTICVGSFASAGTLTPDFVRFAKTKKSARHHYIDCVFHRKFVDVLIRCSWGNRYWIWRHFRGHVCARVNCSSDYRSRVKHLDDE